MKRMNVFPPSLGREELKRGEEEKSDFSISLVRWHEIKSGHHYFNDETFIWTFFGLLCLPSKSATQRDKTANRGDATRRFLLMSRAVFFFHSQIFRRQRGKNKTRKEKKRRRRKTHKKIFPSSYINFCASNISIWLDFCVFLLKKRKNQKIFIFNSLLPTPAIHFEMRRSLA